MSRGPGRIERTLAELLSHNHTDAYTTDELCLACFPDEPGIEKRHRVSVLRAMQKVRNNLGWIARTISGQRGNYIFFNSHNLHSLAIGRTRSSAQGDWSHDCGRTAIITSDKAEAMLLGRDQATYWRSARDESHDVRVDGPFPVLFEMYQAERQGLYEEAELLRLEFNRRVGISVHSPDRICGPIHPDFLKDCKTKGALAS